MVGVAVEYKSEPIEQLRSRESQVRKEFDQEFLDELSRSVKREGVLVPIIVRPVRNGYEIVAGEQRWRAAKAARLKNVPVAIMEADDRRVLEVALLENIKRKDLQGWEREDAIAEMWENGAYSTHDELGRVLDVKGNQVENILLAHKLRRAEKLPLGSSTRMITTTATLDKESRRAILEAQERGDLAKDVHRTTKMVASLKKAPEAARTKLVDALAKSEVRLDEADEMAEIAETNEEVQQLVDAKRSLPERDYKAVISYVKQEKAGGRKPAIKTVVEGDVKIWNTYLNTVENVRNELFLLSPSKCRGWDVEHRERLNAALLKIDHHVHEMLRALSEGGQ